VAELAVDAATPGEDVAVGQAEQRVAPAARQHRDLAALQAAHALGQRAVRRVARAQLPELRAQSRARECRRRRAARARAASFSLLRGCSPRPRPGPARRLALTCVKRWGAQAPGAGRPRAPGAGRPRARGRAAGRRGGGEAVAARTLFQPQENVLPASSAATVCRQPPETSATRRPRSASTALAASWSLRADRAPADVRVPIQLGARPSGGGGRHGARLALQHRRPTAAVARPADACQNLALLTARGGPDTGRGEPPAARACGWADTRAGPTLHAYLARGEAQPAAAGALFASGGPSAGAHWWSPCPSCPYLDQPKLYSTPSKSTATVCRQPQATWRRMRPSRPFTCVCAARPPRVSALAAAAGPASGRRPRGRADRRSG